MSSRNRVIPRAARTQGTYIIGRSGTGKSTFLTSLIADDIAAGAGVIVLDPHGKLIDDALEVVPPTRIDEVDLLDGRRRHPSFGLNLFEIADATDELALSRASNRVVQAFKKVWGVGDDRSWGPNLEAILRAAAYTLLARPGSTLADLPRLLRDDDFRRSVVDRYVRSAPVRDFWSRYESWGRERVNRIEPVLNKVDAFLLNPVVRDILTAPRYHFGQAMDAGRIVYIALPMRELQEEAVALLGAVVVNQILEDGVERHVTERVCYLYCDEFQHFATDAFATLFDEARKYGIATTVAHQGRERLPDQVRNAPLGARNLAIFRVIGQDARVMAEQLKIDEQEREIIGTRPKLEPARDPWGELGRAGHTDDLVMTCYFDIQTGLEVLRKWALWRTGWRDHNDVENGRAVIYAREVDEHATTRYMQRADQALRAYFMRCREMRASDEWRAAADATVNQLIAELPLVPLRWGTRWFDEQEREFRSFIEKYLPQTLSTLQHALMVYPLFTASGDVEPVYGPRRAGSDLMLEMANTLATLPDYQARVRFGSGRAQQEAWLEIEPIERKYPESAAIIRARYERESRVEVEPNKADEIRSEPLTEDVVSVIKRRPRS